MKWADKDQYDKVYSIIQQQITNKNINSDILVKVLTCSIILSNKYLQKDTDFFVKYKNSEYVGYKYGICGSSLHIHATYITLDNKTHKIKIFRKSGDDNIYWFTCPTDEENDIRLDFVSIDNEILRQNKN